MLFVVYAAAFIRRRRAGEMFSFVKLTSLASQPELGVCHILEHHASGMMGHFDVVREAKAGA